MTELDTVSERAAQGSLHKFQSFARAAVDFLVPPRCLACQTRVEFNDTLCGRCWRDVRFIHAPLCDRIGIPLPFDTGGVTISAAALADPPDYDRARAVAHFSGRMQEMIHHLKYGDRQDGRVLFGRWLTAAGSPLFEGADILMPVPLSRRRLLWRRFNQSALLATEVARHTGIAMEPQMLIRRRQTRAQVGLTEAQRRLNVQGAFVVAKTAISKIQGRSVILIDDVITTGATVNACARALRRAGAARIDVLALALVTGESRALA
jgi:ComF family protein